MKLTIFILRTKQIYAKTLTIPESTFKIKTMLLWTLFETLLTSAVTNKGVSTKTRLSNIFKTTNAKTLIKAILDSSFEFLQTP